MAGKKIVYPYIPNSEPSIQQEMLTEIGASSIEELYKDVPENLKLPKKMDLPEPCLSEACLTRHVKKILGRNTPVSEKISFLGAGCYNHHVPAVVDEIINRSEFLTAYAGEPYEDHGRFQALFEYESMMAELMDFDVCNVPTYDGSQASGTALRMASRITGRSEVLVAGNINPSRMKIIKTYLKPDMKVTAVNYDTETGLLDLGDLESKLNEAIAAVFIENPTFLGNLEVEAQKIADLAHKAGSLFVVFVDPSSLGVVAPPSHYGADIACGDVQPLGVHMSYGSGAGFISTSDDPRFVNEYPSRLFGLAPTTEREWGFGDVLWERTSFANRDNAKEFVGTHSALWGIAAGVYLACMGPQGMYDLGKTILQRSQYARKQLDSIRGVNSFRLSTVGFKEFTVDFSDTGKTVEEINKALLDKGIFGGKDLSKDFPELGQSALYCVTEMISKEDIDSLVSCLKEYLG